VWPGCHPDACVRPGCVLLGIAMGGSAVRVVLVGGGVCWAVSMGGERLSGSPRDIVVGDQQAIVRAGSRGCGWLVWPGVWCLSCRLGWLLVAVHLVAVAFRGL